MEHHFYVTENRLGELKTFIRTFTPTVRFKQNPLKSGGEYFIILTMETECGNKLNELFNRWHFEDKPIIKVKKTILNRIINIFK